MNEVITNNGEVLTALVSIIAGGIIRAVERHRLKKKKRLFDSSQDAIDYKGEDK